MSDDTTLELGLFLTAPHPCSYLPEQQARSQGIVQDDWVTTPVYSFLIDNGFRRSGLLTYRPRCDKCNACVSVRLCVNHFTPSRTQKRMYKKHADELTIHLIEHPQFNEEHYALFERYQDLRHADSAPETNPESYNEFLVQSYVNTQFLEFRDKNGILRMISVFDQVEHGLSAVYTFYDPEYKGSLGTFAVMCLAELCVEWQLPYLYLGYWVNNSQKMHYKLNYQPLEYYFDGVWSQTPPNTELSILK